MGEGHQASIPRYAPFSPVSATFKDQLVWNCRGSTDESGTAVEMIVLILSLDELIMSLFVGSSL